jgi:hypothetical protein
MAAKALLLFYSPPPPLFARPRSSRCLVVPDHQEAAGGQDPVPGELQAHVRPGLSLKRTSRPSFGNGMSIVRSVSILVSDTSRNLEK